MNHFPSCHWVLDTQARLHRCDDDRLYRRVRLDTDDPDRERDVALVGAWDVDGERYGRMIAAVPRLLAACQAVVDRWESGDLASAARLCDEALAAALSREPCDETRKTRRVEYYRLWGGGYGQWDTDFLEIPADTPDDQLDSAIRQAVETIPWRDMPPVAVGYYCDAEEEEDEDQEDASAPASAPASPGPADREQVLKELLARAQAAGLRAEDFDETVYELAEQIGADVNNAGLEGQLRYLIGEWGSADAAKLVDQLIADKCAEKTLRDSTRDTAGKNPR